MKKTLIALAIVAIAGTGTAHAEERRIVCPVDDPPGRWLVDGFLASWKEDIGYFKTEHISKEFKTCKMCKKYVDMYAYTEESVGRGGTDGRVPGFDWNFDGTCGDFTE